MKRKLFSILLISAMLLAFMPAAAFAGSGDKLSAQGLLDDIKKALDESGGSSGSGSQISDDLMEDIQDIKDKGKADAEAIEKELNEREEGDAGDTPETARTVSFNTAYTDKIEKRIDKDYFTFTTESDGAVQVSFATENKNSPTASESYWELSLLSYDTSKKTETVIGSAKVMGKDKIVNIPYTGLAKGTYYVRVAKGNEFSDEQYNLTLSFEKGSMWEKENNDSTSLATQINIDIAEPYTGTLGSSTDIDWYRFSLKQDSLIVLNVQPSSTDIGCGWRARLYSVNDSNGKEGISIAFIDAIGGGTASTPLINLKAGDYFIKITNENNWSGERYRFLVETVERDGADWELECNNTIGTANQIGFESPVQGTMGDRNDSDFLNFVTRDEGYVSIAVGAKKQKSKNDYWVVTLLDSEKNQLASFYLNGAETGAFTRKDLPAGRYYINVKSGYQLSSGSWSGDEYTLAVSSEKGPAKVTGLKLKKSGKKAVVSWKAAKRAASYKVYRKTGSKGSYKLVKTTKACKFTDKNVKKGKTYYYKVKACGSLAGIMVSGKFSGAKKLKM